MRQIESQHSSSARSNAHARIGQFRANRVVVAALLAMTASMPASVSAQGAPPPSPPPQMSGHASADAAQLLLNFIISVNRDEVTAGNLAATKATNEQVREYAKRMVDDHTNATAAWAGKAPALSLRVLDSTNITTQTPKAAAGSAAMVNGISEVRDTTSGLRGGTTAAGIHSANLAALKELQSASGAGFDALYLSTQIKMHESVLKELAAQPNGNKDLDTLITIYRSMTEKHLSDAKKLATP